MAESRGGERDRLLGWIDLLVAGVALSAVTTVILVAGAGLQTRLDATEASVRQMMRANLETKATVERLEKARVRSAQVRQLVERQLADVETRAELHWTPALADLSRARPAGVWLTRVSLQGVKLRVEGEAGQPDRAAAYASRLLQSACFDYVAPAAASPTGTGTFVLVGRKAGDLRMRHTERMTSARPLPERLKRGAMRALVHGAVLAIWGTTLGAVVLWPRWTQWQGTQSSLQIQTISGRVLRDQLQVLQTSQCSYEEWSAHRRRALLTGEVPGFCAELKRLLRGTGAQVLSLQRDPLVHVPPVSEPLDPALTGPRVFTGTVQAVPVTLVLAGDFPAIYRSVARLEGQRFLAIVRGAELTRVAAPESAVAGPPPAPAASRIMASLSVHLFVLQSDETDPLTASAPAPSRLTAGAAS